MASREASIPSECLMRMPKIPAGRAADIRAAGAGAAAGPAAGRAGGGRAAEGQAPASAAPAGPRAAEGQAPASAAPAGPGTGGRLRAAARRAAGGLRTVLARHWLMAVLLLAGLVLRVLTQLAYRPAL